MSDEEPQPKPPKKVLRLRQAAIRVLVTIGLLLFYAAIGIHEFLAKNNLFALLWCFIAFGWLSLTIIHVIVYLHVKKGAEVVLRPIALARSPRVPFLISLFFVGLLTLVIAITSLGSLYFCYTVIKGTNNERVIFGLVNLALWLIVVSAWYRLFITQSQIQNPSESDLEQDENVWPPAPSKTAETNNKD